jgi:hypothetical protein
VDKWLTTVTTPARGVDHLCIAQDVHQPDAVTVTLLDGKTAGYGFGMQIKGGLLPQNQPQIYESAKRFVENLGPSGFLDDGP